ncbi:GNAT family N-acetyltransferase [Caballeronia sp. LP006]|uniref:GNAT family N-acetyltransferase n=1 Tax=Caballeronia sp. LP006 TaxID=3038552 RepID=UPI00285A5E26|nr:GNAT family N-acetyltransferase [Caballeronia sp. LP006]MDR5828097.1 GNAT family N-acetyltransferase [Caballeronia sp. LP006]
MNTAKYVIDLIKSPDEFEALHKEWDELWTLADGRHHESFAVCSLVWRHVAKPAGRSLCIITARREERIVAIWPLVRSRNRLWNVLRPLSSESADYTTVLTDPAYASPDLSQSIWQAARDLGKGDIVLLPYVDCKSELYRLAAEHPGIMLAKEHPYAVAKLSEVNCWEEFVIGLGKLSGKRPGQLRERLEREGKFEVCILGPHDREENARMVDWMLARKREWGERVDKKGSWLWEETFRNYLIELLNHCHPLACAKLMVLKLDGEILAVNMIGLGAKSMIGLIASFDKRFGTFAPGAVSTEAWVRWAIEQRLDFDLGIGAETFKPYWSRGNTAMVCSLQLAQTNWGRVAFAISGAQRMLKKASANIWRSNVRSEKSLGKEQA